MRELPDTVTEGDSGWVLQGVLSRASFRRQPLSGQKKTFTVCEGEVLVIRPRLLGESAQGYLLLNLREDERQEEVLEDKDEEEKESEFDEKVKAVIENAQLMHATW